MSCVDDDDFNDGVDFDTIGQTFEVSNVDFVSNDGLSAAVNIVVPSNVDVFESDVPLVFILDPEATANEGVDVFEPLPRTFFFDNAGFAQYRFNFIFDDTANIFDLDLILESDDFDALDATFTQNQIFRIVIVPSQFAAAPENQNLSLGQVMNKLNLEL
ncbi:hypothetical protein D7030_09015 [Flavobacteriaceae bacterium AU392]|nr:hypothetical protein D1817_15020 [Flavobacteriaceae bacterium]RKM84154.1 hypothetical protein D7030_09015 [Flavobacteriaceae bacterium AU392]